MASINEKLNYINETKSLIKDKLNDLGSEIDNEITFREYAEKIEDLYEEWPKINDENTIINLENTKKAKMNLQLKGNINQSTTTGKNKCKNVSQQTATNIDFYFDNDIQQIISLSFTCNETLLTNSLYLNIDGTNYGIAGTISGSANSKVSATVSFSQENYEAIQNGTTIFLKLYKSGASFSVPNDAQIENGNNVTSYEPYTGGIVSPNSDYPQDIQIVTGNNNIIIESKNLLNTDILDGAHANDTYYGYGFWAFKITTVPGVYTLSRQDNTMDPDNGYLAIGQGTNIKNAYDNKSWLMHPSLSNLNRKQVTLTNTNELWLFTSASRNNIEKTIEKAGYLLLEKGSIASDYVPYIGATYPINLNDLELCKIQNVQDYIYKDSNDWYKKPMILKISNYNGETISTDYVSTTGDLTTGATVYYINANINPEGIKITDIILINQLNILEQALSYDNQTNISQENDNLPFIINVTALIKNSD